MAGFRQARGGAQGPGDLAVTVHSLCCSHRRRVWQDKSGRIAGGRSDAAESGEGAGDTLVDCDAQSMDGWPGRRNAAPGRVPQSAHWGIGAGAGGGTASEAGLYIYIICLGRPTRGGGCVTAGMGRRCWPSWPCLSRPSDRLAAINLCVAGHSV